ncbi:MAG: hypothetical protein LBD70_07455, partial [Bifidobacteriaceae bacterium]|nr:hypothetical protein [Bifidobacteriaceae bacterium]
MYRLVFNLFLRWLDPERAHRLAFSLIAAMGRCGPARRAVAACSRVPPPARPIRLFGRSAPGPLGLAASFDK